jgi:hypothetical protein
MYAGGSTGLAVLRRDGFASLGAGEEAGVMLTRPLTFTGSHLFVNVNAPDGELRAGVLDEHGQPIQGFSHFSCNPVRTDSTSCRITWQGAGDLSSLTGRPVRLEFHLRQGELYSFWISPSLSGCSRGFVAAGGPGYVGAIDSGGA